MMVAVYVVLGWSLVGFATALLLGRTMAICAGERKGVMVGADGAARPVSTPVVRSARAA